MPTGIPSSLTPTPPWPAPQRYGLSTDSVQKANPQLDPKTLIIRAGDIISLPCAGNATSGASPLDLLSRRSDLSILFKAALAAGDEFVKTLNGGWVGLLWGQ